MDTTSSASDRRGTHSWLAWILCAIVCGLAVFNMGQVVRFSSAETSTVKLISDIAWRAMTIVFAVLAALVIARQPQNRIGWLLMIPAVTLVLETPIDTYLSGFKTAPEPTFLNLLLTWLQNWSWMALILPLALILLLFPTGSPPSPRWRWLPKVGLGLFVYFLLLNTFVQHLSDQNDIWKLSNPLGLIPDFPLFYSLLVMPWVACLGVFVLLCTISLLVRYRHAAFVERLQIKWLLLASLIFTLSYLPQIAIQNLTHVNSDMGDLLVMVTITLLPTAIAIAILRYRLWDIDLVINRTLVYASLTACVVGIYILVVGYLSLMFRTENNLFLPLVATGIVAVIFDPLRNTLQRGVNRLMYGERDDPYRVLTRLGQQLEASLEPSAALTSVVETLAKTLKLPYVAIVLRQGENPQVVAAFGLAQVEVARFPLNYAGETFGEVLVAKRAPGEPFNSGDRRLLSDLARQIAVAAHATRLADELERARLHIVTASEEARRRLGSDLHDGVGHQLVGLARQTERAAKLLHEDPQTAAQLLRTVTAEFDRVISQVRQLAHQLYPPELEVLGLVGALRERIQANADAEPFYRLTMPETMPALPTAVESAAYYIALEALTNIRKHASAHKCEVRLAIIDEETDPSKTLALDICDDGHGFSSGGSGGLGMLSMQARAAEVGGECTISANPGGGTRVSVRLPCLI